MLFNICNHEQNNKRHRIQIIQPQRHKHFKDRLAISAEVYSAADQKTQSQELFSHI